MHIIISIAIDSVIAADTERTRLFAEEKRLLESNYENAGELLAEIHTRLDEVIQIVAVLFILFRSKLILRKQELVQS